MHRTRVTRKSAQGEMTHRSANARAQPALQRFLVAIGYRAGEAYLSYSFTAYPAGFVKSREINLKSFLVLPKINSLSSLSVLFTVPSWVCPHVEVFQVAQITNVNQA